ncbi:MAG: hypothetical protein EOP83_09955 [Verrucomicrobiaceae bacterium]|nr:MAG: hypothetical protein EOP83_09955 [Verrucomicrobiaceae bacterium]
MDTLFAKLSSKYKQRLITQFYLSDNVRFRRIETEGDPEISRCFTFKKEIAGKVLEIERQVSHYDYILAQTVAVSELHKVRFKVPGAEPDTHWDIDFLVEEQGGPIYFALAECEFPENANYEILSDLEGHIALVVPPHSARFFSNSRLTDQEYARNVLQDYLGVHHALSTSTA